MDGEIEGGMNGGRDGWMEGGMDGGKDGGRGVWRERWREGQVKIPFTVLHLTCKFASYIWHTIILSTFLFGTE